MELPQEGITNYCEEKAKAVKAIKDTKREKAIEVLKKSFAFSESKLSFKGDNLKKYLHSLGEDDIYEARWAINNARKRGKFDNEEFEAFQYINKVTLKFLKKEYDLTKLEIIETDKAYNRMKHGASKDRLSDKLPCDICGKVLKDPKATNHTNSDFHKNALETIERIKEEKRKET